MSSQGVVVKPFSFLVLSLLLAVSSFGATRTWTGTASGQWTVAANWGGTAPVAGDSLVFPAGAPNLNNTNDFPAGTLFDQIAIDDAGYVLNGNLIAIGPAGIITASGGTINLPLQLTANLTSFGVTGGTLRLNGGIDLAGFSLDLFSNGGSGVAGGPITGSGPASGAIVKTGPDFWTLSAANTFSGPIAVQNGSLFARDPSAFGVADDTAANGTFVGAGGRLVFDPFVYAPEYITLNGSGVSNDGVLFSNGAVQLTGTVVLGSGVAMNVLAGPSILFSGIVTGSGTFGMGGGGTYILANSGNNFTGGVVWGAGGLPSNSTLTLAASNTLPASVAIDVGAGGLFNVNGQTQSIASLAGSGNVSLGTGGILTVTGGTTTYSGAIGGSGAITHTGGILTLTGNSTYAGTYSNTNGTTSVSAGTLPAAYTQSGGALALSSGGTMGAVTINGGAFIPGDGGTGIGNTGSLTLAPAALYSEGINGTAAGSFGNVRVTGGVNLGGASLEVVGFGTGVAAGNTFVMIDNDGADPVIGTFAGLPQGSTIPSGPGGFDYTISYSGGNGNDVTLTAVLPAAAVAIPSLDLRGLALLVMLLGVAAVVAMRQ
jgi:fibronectin-binding autotransporter adhesin